MGPGSTPACTDLWIGESTGSSLRMDDWQCNSAPLRQAIGMEGQPVLVHVPFTTSDLLNWKQLVGSYQENIEGMHQLLETIMLTHNPNWGDIQAMFNAFFMIEERRMVLEKAKEECERRNVVGSMDDYVPKTEPDWDPNRAGGKTMLKQYQQLILYGVQHGVPKPKNVSKLYEVRQEQHGELNCVY
uniref:Core shell protein Gag P30 domain-containing protein n=1 Tax=Buteo japonicus TaxID=224669 RepID=A0A8C0BLZ0_9AVES